MAISRYVSAMKKEYKYMKAEEYPELRYGFKRNSSIPNIIWSYWSGDKIPSDVQMYMNEWRRLCPDYELRIIKHNDPDFKDIFALKYADNPQRTSDFIRLAALEKYGGIWLDSTMILHSPLNWVNAYQDHDNSEFVGYYLQAFSSRPEYPTLENWFLASIPNSTFIRGWKKEFYKINEYDKVEDYVEYIKKYADTQYIYPTDYLTMHIAAQKVLQEPGSNYKLTCLKAEDTPYNFLHRTGFKMAKGVALIRHGVYDEAPIIKLSKHPKTYLTNSFYGWAAYFLGFAKQ
ncbi:hypothetical protein HDV01_004665 [Terramyces sp. JEL0728]|nr:hypothetical protein HDV01_004665 [Terramyces sp. JEL0728]